MHFGNCKHLRTNLGPCIPARVLTVHLNGRDTMHNQNLLTDISSYFCIPAMKSSAVAQKSNIAILDIANKDCRILDVLLKILKYFW